MCGIGESVTFASVFSSFCELETTVRRDPAASVRNVLLNIPASPEALFESLLELATANAVNTYVFTACHLLAALDDLRTPTWVDMVEYPTLTLENILELTA